jgi:NADH-quinone oxidoreductase subunit N
LAILAQTMPAITGLGAVVPEVILGAWGLLLLLVDAVARRRGADPSKRRARVGALALLGCFAAIAWMLRPLLGLGDPSSSDPDPLVFGGALADDMLTSLFGGLLVLMLAMVVGISMSGVFDEDWGAYLALLFWSTAGMLLLVAAENLLMFFLSLELMAICLYVASAMEKRRPRSAEAGLKYFIYGSVASALLLFGLSLIYGMTGETQYAAIRSELSLRAGGVQSGLGGDLAGAVAVLLVLVGLGFKVAAVPFHQWAPDTYEGAPAPVAAWVASGSKLASFIALIKLLVVALGPWAGQLGEQASRGWIAVIALVSAITMTFGNLAALRQRNFKRLLGYSSIAHTGYILIGVLAMSLLDRKGSQEAAAAVLYYLVIYGITTLGAFAAAAWLAVEGRTDDIRGLNGLGRRSPALGVGVALAMLSLLGFPPLAGFFAKLYVFLEVLETSEPARTIFLALVGLALLNTVISAFYYVRVLRAMFLRAADENVPAPKVAPRGIAWPIAASALVAVAAGVYPTPVMDSLKAAGSMMLAISPPLQTRLQTEAERFDPKTDPQFLREQAEERAKRPMGMSPGG